MQDVQAAVVAHRRVDRRLDAVFPRDIRGDGDAGAAGLGHDMGGLLPRGGIDFGDNDLGPLGGHRARRGPADPGTRARDQGDLSFQTCQRDDPPPVA